MYPAQEVRMLSDLFDLSELSRDNIVHRLFFESDKPWEWLKNLNVHLRRIPTQRVPYMERDPRVSLNFETGPIYIEPGAIIESYAVIEGPAYIGAGAVIGPHATVTGSLILSKAVVGHCSQVKRSIFFPGAKAPHLNYVGDSVVGRDVNLGAGVTIANLPLRTHENGVRIVWGDEAVSTQMRKLGAIIGDRAKLACNCTLSPGVVISKDTVVLQPMNLRGASVYFGEIGEGL